MEEWQNPDSGYLNCIGVGDTYVRRQMERIFRQHIIRAREISYDPHPGGIDVNIENPQLVDKKEWKY